MLAQEAAEGKKEAKDGRLIMVAPLGHAPTLSAR
jgi:hypothetical protein